MLECTGVLMPVADRSNYFTRVARGLPLSRKVKKRFWYHDRKKACCSFQATFLLRGAGLAPHDRNDDGGVGWLTRLCRRAALTIRLCLMPRRRFFPRSPR